MGCSTFLADNLGPLALDTSVLINLNACTYGERILAAIPNDIFVPKIVEGELEHERSRTNGEYQFLQNLVASETIMLAGLTDEAWGIFQELTSSSPSLDDGEAATIAVSATQHFFPVIDEKRGRARATTFIKSGESFCSLDILLHPLVAAELGDDATIEALYKALRNGRMRIPAASVDKVIALIGTERAIHCTCLPGYRERFSPRANVRAVR
jgi:predicted nucleic acid-binding protein